MPLSQDNIFYQGDTLELEYQLWQDKAAGIKYDLTNYQIRFQLNCTPVIKKATSNVTGGSTAQINVTDATNGIFVVYITKTESAAIALADYAFEIEITSPAPASEKFTILKDQLRLVDKSIDWENV